MTYYVELSSEFIFLTTGKCYPVMDDGTIVDNDHDRRAVSPQAKIDKTALIIE